MNAPHRTRCVVRQVHGNDVLDLGAEDHPTADRCADALVTSDPTKLLSIQTADCVPILVATADAATVAAIHAGWRGVLAEVVPRAVCHLRNHAGPERQRRPGSSVQTLVAAIGPCISFDAFEVGAEVAERFASHFQLDHAQLIRQELDGTARVDLRAAVRLQLIHAGLSPDRIDATDRCTHKHVDEFFSHRRDRGLTGRMAAVIGPRP